MSEYKPIRVLYMEDDAGAARLFVKRLERLGFSVETAPNGEAGLAKYAPGAYDILFVDGQMPIMGGLDVIRTLASHGHQTPIVMLTGTGDEMTAVQAIKLGAGDYIIKDVDGSYIELLPTVIHKVLQQHQLSEETRRALEELRESEERFRGIIESTHDYYWVARIANPADFSRAVVVHGSLGLGIPANEFMDQSEMGAVRRFHAAWSWKNLEEACLQVFSTGKVISEVQTGHVDSKGNVVEYFASEIFPFKKGGMIVGVQGLSEDITQSRKAEEKIKRYAEELKRSNEDLERFAFVASHDLQEPLRKVAAFGERIRDNYESVLGETGNDYMSRILNAARRMQNLIEDLLQYSRIGVKGKPFEPVDLEKLISEVSSNLEIRIGQSGGRVILEQRDGVPLPKISADATQMRQLFQNLIGNSLKFHKKGVPPVVRIWAAKDPSREGFWQICVEDNGIGFDEKYVDRIFTPFERLNPHSDYEGTGLGLTICHRIVSRHGGSIAVKSKPGEGAVFFVILPENQLA